MSLARLAPGNCITPLLCQSERGFTEAVHLGRLSAFRTHYKMLCVTPKTLDHNILCLRVAEASTCGK